MILTTVYTNTLFRPLGCHSRDIFATSHMKNYALRIVAISLYFNKLVTIFNFQISFFHFMFVQVCNKTETIFICQSRESNREPSNDAVASFLRVRPTRPNAADL